MLPLMLTVSFIIRWLLAAIWVLPRCEASKELLEDLPRSRADFIAENALLRHQLVILKRQSKRPKLTQTDRVTLLSLAMITKQ